MLHQRPTSVLKEAAKAMKKCTKCDSYAINPGMHGRGKKDIDLCDVCYWRKRAESAIEASRYLIKILVTDVKKHNNAIDALRNLEDK